VFSQVTVDGTTYTSQELIQNVLIGNPNFPAMNFVTSTGTDFGSVNGIGAFNAGGTDLPFNQGIVLSTGNINSIPGPNTSVISEGSNTWPGDVDLQTVTAVDNTNNASFIQFDFVAQVDLISLDFLMASEEYGTFECSFADTFAFILTNVTTGISGNIAVVPNTNTPISILSVRGGANTTCPPSNIAYFGRYNYDVMDPSIPSIDAANSPINFQGQTGIFMLMGNLVIGDTYSIKIVVGDALDTAFDSALFVRNSSFGAYPVMEEEPGDIVVADLDNNGYSVFNLRDNEPSMLGAVDTNIYSFDFTYHTSLADAEAGINAIVNPETYTNTSDPEDIFVSMRNTYTGTSITSSFKITTDATLLNVDTFELSDVVLHPNPVVDELFINTEVSLIEKVEIYTINGQLVISENANETNTIKIDFSSLTKGMYLVKLMSKKGTIFKRIIK